MAATVKRAARAPKPRCVGQPWTEATRASAAHGRAGAGLQAADRHARQRRLPPAGGAEPAAALLAGDAAARRRCRRSARQRVPDGAPSEASHDEQPTPASEASPAASTPPMRRPTRRRAAPCRRARRPHESAHLHVAGEATYIDDMPELAGTLHCALGLSPVAHGALEGDRPRRACARCPAWSRCCAPPTSPAPTTAAPIVHDDPILARRRRVRYLGQPVFAVVAHTRDAARRAAALAKDVLDVEPLPPVLTPQEAHAQAAVRAAADAPGARRRAQAAIAAAPHRLTGTLRRRRPGAVLPRRPDQLRDAAGGRRHARALLDPASRARCSTWWRMRCTATRTAVQVECRRMGGGFGGKESQSALFACVAAVAAAQLQRPVKLRLDRDDDFMITGRRHCFWYDYEVGYDDDGRVLGAEIDDGLARRPLGRPVGPGDDARAVPLRQRLLAAATSPCTATRRKTNTQSNTAFRGFGGPQGAIAIENILDAIARALGRDPLDVRRANFYGTSERQRHALRPDGRRQRHPRARRRARATQRLPRAARRRSPRSTHEPGAQAGIALTPVKFGISFNVNALQPGRRAGARLHRRLDAGEPRRHRDGPGPEHQGGAGRRARTRRAASTRVRVHRHRHAEGRQHLGHRGIDRQRPERQGGAGRGAADPRAAGRLRRGAPRRRARERCASPTTRSQVGGTRAAVRRRWSPQAYLARVQLWSDGFYATPGLSWDRDTHAGPAVLLLRLRRGGQRGASSTR